MVTNKTLGLYIFTHTGDYVLPQVSFQGQSDRVPVLCASSEVLQLRLNLYHNHLTVVPSPV